MKIDAGFMHVKLKRGWGTDDFSRRLDMPPDVFIETLRKTFTKRAYDSMLNDLQKNDKSKNKYYNNLKKKKGVKKKKINVDSNLSIEEKVEEKFYEKEKFLSDSLYELEVKLKNNTCERRSLYGSLREEKIFLENLQIEVKKHETKVLAILDDINKLTDDSKKVRSEIKKINDELKKYAEIMVTIFAYEDGNVEVDQDLNIPDSNSIFIELLQSEVVENLTLMQVKQLSKVISCVKILNEKGIKYNVLFDFKEEEKAYESLNSKI